jgi:Zn-finger nucleic acid-binding protein
MGLFSKSKKVTDIRIWQCPECKAILEKGGLGTVIFVGESSEKISGTGTCNNCGAAFAQSEIYGGKYDYKERVTGVDKSKVPGRLSLIIFRPGQSQPSNPEKYYEHVLKKAYGDSSIKVDVWRIAGTRSFINASEAKALYEMGKARGMFPDFGEPGQEWSGKGLDGEQVTALFFVK